MFFPQKSRLHPQVINISVKQTRPIRYRPSVCGNAAAEMHDSPHFPQSGRSVGMWWWWWGFNRAPQTFKISRGSTTGNLVSSSCQSDFLMDRAVLFPLLRRCRDGETTHKPNGTFCAHISGVKRVVFFKLAVIRGVFRHSQLTQLCMYDTLTHVFFSSSHSAPTWPGI